MIVYSRYVKELLQGLAGFAGFCSFYASLQRAGSGEWDINQALKNLWGGIMALCDCVIWTFLASITR
jgi:hypothetical protein